MRLEVRFFAALREALGTGALEVEVPPDVCTVAALRAWLGAREPAWSEALAPKRRIRVALDQRLVHEDAVIHEGAEVAFFPPVTGG